jgi:hypothetical protein
MLIIPTRNPQYFLYRLLRCGFFCLGLSLPNASHADERYKVSTDGQEVQDTQTGLIWRRCVEGMAWDGKTCTGTYGTYTHEQAFQRATSEANRTGIVWRLPNIEELFSLVDINSFNSAIDKTAFPRTPPQQTWSSTPYLALTGSAWNVHFYIGDVGFSLRSGSKVVRLLRDEQ